MGYALKVGETLVLPELRNDVLAAQDVPEGQFVRLRVRSYADGTWIYERLEDWPLERLEEWTGVR